MSVSWNAGYTKWKKNKLLYSNVSDSPHRRSIVYRHVAPIIMFLCQHESTSQAATWSSQFLWGSRSHGPNLYPAETMLEGTEVARRRIGQSTCSTWQYGLPLRGRSSNHPGRGWFTGVLLDADPDWPRASKFKHWVLPLRTGDVVADVARRDFRTFHHRLSWVKIGSFVSVGSGSSPPLTYMKRRA